MKDQLLVQGTIFNIYLFNIDPIKFLTLYLKDVVFLS